MCLALRDSMGSIVTVYPYWDNGCVSESLWIAIAVIAVLVVAAVVVYGLVRYRRGKIKLDSSTSTDTATPVDRSGGYAASSTITFTQSSASATAPPPTKAPPERLDTSGLPAVGDDATIPRDAPKRPIADVALPEAPSAPAAPGVEPGVEQEAPAAPDIGAIAPTEGRLERLRGRLSKSQNALGRSMLGLLGGGDLDEDSWEAVEDTLLVADLGAVTTESVVTALRGRLASGRVRTEADARAVLREVLVAELRPDLDRSVRALPHDDHPSVLLVVGVNGTGKTTTVGKLARVLVADGR